MSPALSIFGLARCSSRRAGARRVARSILVPLRAAVGAFYGLDRFAISRDSLTQSGAGLVAGKAVHARTIIGGASVVAGSVAGVLPCAP